MTGDAEPRWDLLPHRPEEFFGLDGEYDLRDLKRRYNALIRRFKPEKSPEEFQRIRAAYEMLSESLRYGEPPRSRLPPETTQFDWSALTGPDRSPSSAQSDEPSQKGPQTGPHSTLHPGEPAETVPQGDDQSGDAPLQRHSTAAGPEVEAPPLHQRLNHDSPEALYTELAERQPKTPYDYYALAVLSDVADDDPLGFPGWLLEGLKEHSDEPGLFQLLHEYFSSDAPTESLTELLEKTSRVVRTDRFYYLTERLWDRLLRQAPFDTFRRTLDSCEANLRDHEFDHQVTFYLHILKPALWKADDAWLEETFTHIDAHYDRLPHWAEEELDVLDYLRMYRNRRSEFLDGGGPMRARIDQAIVGYCTCEESEADRRFLECQHAIVTHPEQLLREFPVPSDGFDYVLIPWEHITEDVAMRVGEEPILLAEAPAKRRVRRLAVQLAAEEERRGFRFIYNLVLWILGLGLVALIGCLVYYGSLLVTALVQLRFMDSLWALLKLGGLMLLALAVVILFGGVVRWMERRIYRLCYRREILAFFQTTAHPPSQVADELENLEGKTIDGKELDKAEESAKLLRKDVAMTFYVTAQRLLV